MKAIELIRQRVRRAQAAADDFNARHPVGTLVRVWLGARTGEGQVTQTREPARIVQGSTAVVWVQGRGAPIALSHVEVIEP